MLERIHIVDQKQRAQSALGFLVAFTFAAVISLGGLILPALFNLTPDPVQASPTGPVLPGLSPDEVPQGGNPNEPTEPAQPVNPTAVLTPTPVLPSATIGGTGGAGANIRSSAGLGGTIIKILPDGTQVFLLEGDEEVDGFEWQYIEMPDTRTGWIVIQYLIPDN